VLLGWVSRRRCSTTAPAPPSARKACVARVAVKFHPLVTLQPAGRDWPFQWYQTAIFAGLALLLAGVCFWWIRHRLS
jgi:hypothetical protein